jgi:hypothetical protein
VRLLEVESGGQLPVPHAEQRLEEADDACRALQMPDVGLYGADAHGGQRLGTLDRNAAGREGGTQGGGLRGVSDGRAGAVQFDVLQLPGSQAGPLPRPAQHPLLGGRAGHGQALRGTVVVDGAAADHTVDAVTVRHGPLQRLEDQHRAAFAGHEAVGPGVEGVAATVRGQRSEPLLGDGVLGEDVEIHTGGDRRGGLAGAQALTGQVHGHQRRGLRRVDGQARPLQAQMVRDPTRDHAPVQACHGVLGDGGGAVLVEQGGIVVAQRADEHRGPAAPEPLGQRARLLEGLPDQFQYQPLLRVHGSGLAR